MPWSLLQPASWTTCPLVATTLLVVVLATKSLSKWLQDLIKNMWISPELMILPLIMWLCDLRTLEESLAGKVWSLDFSKFSDTDTNMRHVQICWKKAWKVPNFGQWNLLSSMLDWWWPIRKCLSIIMEFEGWIEMLIGCSRNKGVKASEWEGMYYWDSTRFWCLIFLKRKSGMARLSWAGDLGTWLQVW